MSPSDPTIWALKVTGIIACVACLLVFVIGTVHYRWKRRYERAMRTFHAPEPEKEPSGTYTVYFTCPNCAERTRVDIPRGTRKDEMEPFPCRNCGCLYQFTKNNDEVGGFVLAPSPRKIRVID